MSIAKTLTTSLCVSIFSIGLFANSTNTPSEKSSNTFSICVDTGIENMTGDTTYAIGYPVTVLGGGTYDGYFPFSQLKWPLDTNLIRADIGINFNSAIRANLTLKKSVTKPNDKMIDKDWITDSNPQRLDIYSSSNISDFKAFIFDLSVEWIFVDSSLFNLYGGLGYRHQYFNYHGKLIHQYSPSGIPNVEAWGDGRVGITYEITYEIPYLLIGSDFTPFSNLNFNADFSYSPYTVATDEDHHLLRDKTTTGDMDGDTLMVNIDGTYTFDNSIFINIGFSYTKIDVEGSQDQYFSGVQRYTLKEKSNSTQKNSYLNIGYKF